MSEAYQKALRQDGCACGQSPSCLRQPGPSNMAKWRSSPEGFLGRSFGSYAVCDNCKRYAKADADKRAEELAAKRLRDSPFVPRTQQRKVFLRLNGRQTHTHPPLRPGMSNSNWC